MSSVKPAALAVGRRLAVSRNQGASYKKGGMIAMPQKAVMPPKKPAFAKALPGMKKGGKAC